MQGKVGISNFSTRAVESIGELRRVLDQLEGVSRTVGEGVDPDYFYKNLVLETAEGGLTTGYSNAAKNARYGMHFTDEEIKAAGRGISNEPPAIWSARDDIQQKLVGLGRRLPYLLPSMYATQRGITDPLFGNNDQKSKVNWYNPVDVLADFAKQSVMNTIGVLAPFEVAGAATTTARRSLATSLYSGASTPFKQKLQNRFVDLNTVLGEVGHDVSKVVNKVIRTSTQLSGAFNKSIEAARLDQPTQGQVFKSVKQGIIANQHQSTLTQIAKTAFLGDKTAEGTGRYGAVDLIPTLSGFRSGFAEFQTRFKVLGEGYDALTQAISNDRALLNISRHFVNRYPNAADRLEAAGVALNRAKEDIAFQHGSRLTSFVGTIDNLMAGHNTYGTRYSTKNSKFFEELLRKELRGQVETHLINEGASSSAAKIFSSQVQIKKIPRGGARLETSQVFGFGKDDIFKEGPDFYKEIATRAAGIKGLSSDSGLSGDVIQRALSNANKIFATKEFQKNVKSKINSQWRTFYDQSLVNHTGGILKPERMSLSSFNNNLNSSQKEYLQRKAASVLGIKLTDSNGRMVSNDIISNQLARNGLDSNNFSSLRGFLLNNKQLTKPVSSSGYNFLGLRPVSFDEARNRGFFNYLDERQNRILLDINRQMGFNDPISTSIGKSTVNGLYANRSGTLIDTTKLTGTIRSLGNFFASEFEIPIVHLNANTLFGLGQMQEMAKKGPIHFVPGNTVQPFGEISKHQDSQFFIYETKRSFLRKTKGTVTAYGIDEAGEQTVTKLPGYYRPGNNLSQAFIARQAKYASGLIGEAMSSVRAGQPLSLSQRLKSRLDFADEQSSSVFELAKRFNRRKIDINNPTVISQLVQEKSARAGSRNLRLDIQGEGPTARFSVFDQRGRLVADNEQFISSATRLFEGTSRYGFSDKVIAAIERRNSRLFQFAEREGTGPQSVSKLKTVQQAVDFAKELKYVDDNVVSLPSGVKSYFSRIDQILEQGSLLAPSQAGVASPSITTRLDEIKSELFKYLGLRNAAIRQTSGAIQEDPLISIVNTLTELRRSGAISPTNLIEAQGAALSTLFNSAAFSTYSSKSTSLQNATATVYQAITRAESSQQIKNLIKPIIDSRTSLLTTSVKRPFSGIVPFFNKQFGAAPYSTINERANPLGSNANTTFIPTFGTQFGRDPFAAISSALGVTTYSNPQSFSGMSVIPGHSIERLNRYFGTLGMQLDVSKYKSPVDLYVRGMIGKRVLPIVAGSSTVLAADRTLGGFLNERDINNERVYSPYLLGALGTGVVEAQSIAAGAIPGGLSYQEKREELVDGEVPIRQGRFWPLGNTPFQGGKIMYYRPSWYRKLQAGAMFTSDTYGSPAEKLLFYNDFSPLRPLDPYKFERKHYSDRPYPVTGEYFTGPWGPLTSVLNSTVGKILKPQQTMHREQLEAGLVNYTRVGQSGAFDTSGYLLTQKGSQTLAKEYPYLSSVQGEAYAYSSSGAVRSDLASVDAITKNQSNIAVGSIIGSVNQGMSSLAGSPMGTASVDVSERISLQNRILTSGAYGPPKLSGAVPPRIVPAGSPIEQGSLPFQISESAYRVQELLGIYGFMGGTLREKFGFGSSDFEPNRAVLQSASKAYGTGRAFWDLNLGGMGDVPLPGQGPLGNIEISEVIRRFIPKERTGVDYLNPIQNRLGQQYPFLPGPDYFINFKTGDPYTRIQEGELRLPGIGYERFNTPTSDYSGRYGAADQFNILGDVAPYSPEFRSLNRQINYKIRTPEERIKVQQTREQVENTTRREDFSSYKYRYSSPEESNMGRTSFYLARSAEYLAHRDTIFNTKFSPKRTAAEDWERQNIYGTTFPEWQRPFESFISPMLYKATQRSPLAGAAIMGALGSAFGATPRAKVVGSFIGATSGAVAGAYGSISEAVTGDRFIPQERKKQMALEEYVDILSYVKNMSISSQAQQAGDIETARRYKSAAGRTMYGADIYGASVETLSLAIPKRKREHFREMLNAPTEERERILSTAPRLERRIFQAAWGMQVEKKPDLVDYFSKNELPSSEWEGWHPNTNMEHVKVKIGQSMGIEMSQMGYYPQQLKEANLANPSYPSMMSGSGRSDTLNRLRRLMLDMGMDGSVTPVFTPFAGERIDMSVGVR